jgi:hypothetical protein
MLARYFRLVKEITYSLCARSRVTKTKDLFIEA